MAKRKSKARLVEEMCESLGLPKNQMEQLPRILGELARRAGTPPCMVTFAFDPGTGRILQVSVSDFPKVVKAYSTLARATMNVAAQFQRKVQEGLDGNLETVEADAGTSEDVERGNGRGPERLEVGKAPSVASPNDSLGD